MIKAVSPIELVGLAHLYLGLYASSDDPAVLDLEEAFERSRLVAGGITHLLLYPHKSSSGTPHDVQKAEPSSWFTSLWTLQDVCLHPEILLCDQDWRPLTIGHN